MKSTLVLTALTVVLFALVEMALAISLPLSIYLTALAVLWVCAGLASRGSGSRTPLWVVATASMLLTLLFVVPWTSRKRFLRHLDRVEAGMTVEAVHRLMEPYAATRSGAVESYRHAESGRFASDYGQVVYENGEVVETHFLPD